MQLTKRVLGKLRVVGHRALKKRGNVAFLMQLEPHSRMLDVGCGNNSPAKCKAARPDIHYIGLDIGDYNQDSAPVTVADEYVLVGPDDFSGVIARYEGQLDAIVSSHNLEHCNNPDDVLLAMGRSLKPGGKLFLSFPSEQSVNFPSRRGTLNFFDDETHINMLKFSEVCSTLEGLGLEIDFAAEQYRARVLAFVGSIFEPLSRLLNKQVPFGATWAFYGFESVIWATCPGTASPAKAAQGKGP